MFHIILLLIINDPAYIIQHERNIPMKIESTPKPVLGTNSYDCWSLYMTEEIALRAIDIFVKKLKPHGYEYFCFDAAWYCDDPFHAERDPERKGSNELDEFGRWNASKVKFPHGLKFITDYCHANGIKFGIHFFRGIPKLAVERNTKIMGIDLHAGDIIDTINTCEWGVPNYGVDMSKPGAQEYYDSVIRYFDENGVDFLKVDDITESPDEIAAVGKAIEKASRPIFLSLSPGDRSCRCNLPVYRKYANMLRISGDVWDRPDDIHKRFTRWDIFEDQSGPDCWLDLDMVPFGELQSYIPEGVVLDVPHDLDRRRKSRLTMEQKRTFITQHALSATPILYGGNLEKTDDDEFALLTNPEMIKCNQNGIMGKQIFGQRYLSIYQTPDRNDPAHGWLGLFNIGWEERPIRFKVSDLNLPEGVDAASLNDVWTGRKLEVNGDTVTVTLKELECYFIAY